ncbi:hypothetical protein CASFOL_021516 [Castilleja foliolosa]|uniref:CRC domain-containing protein n=1 Tax=Castilleja foliolosa TaxID=1961234 RepID=A0ABD3CYB5_9LAMI
MEEDNSKGVMGTPEKSKNNEIANPISKFEDSPVFNFINSLSPIKPVKSLPITQTINPLTFEYLQSVFTSPRVSSLKESRFLRRNQLSDPSKPEFSSNDHKENLDPMASNSDASNMPPSSEECSNLIVEFSKNLEYNRVNPNNPNSNDSYENKIDQNKQNTSCDWDDFISSPSNLLTFGSSDNTEPHKQSVDPATNYYTCIKNAIQNTLMVSGGRAGESHEPENLFTQPEEESEMMMESSKTTVDVNAGSSISNLCENMDYQHLSGLYRGMKRRSLVYNMAGPHEKHLADNSSSDSGNDSSQRVLPPGIGLHLNALASNPNDYNNVVNHDSLASRRLLIGPGLHANFHPPIFSGQELLRTNVTDYSLEREIENVDNGVVQVENEEINPSSPKKKRRRLEQAGEGEGSCKRCNCKKSKCLKLYCECFAAGVYCVEPCACIDCFNKPIHEDTVLATRKQIESRNPLAFAPKVIRGSGSSSEIRDDFSKTPASARHKRGCNCKKSGCLKKYCECYQGGVGCSINCRCEGCKNAFGRKDGSGVSSTDHEFEEDETNTSEKAEMNAIFPQITIRDNLDQTMDYSLHATPLTAVRQLAQPNKRPSFSSIPSSNFAASQEFEKSSFFQAPPKFGQFSETIEDYEMPEFLLEGSPNSGAKLSLSPNGKRVTPPKRRLERSSTGLRSSRKLILRSIPSFPSLTHNQ